MVARHIGIGALALMLARKVGAANAPERLLQKFMARGALNLLRSRTSVS